MGIYLLFAILLFHPWPGDAGLDARRPGVSRLRPKMRGLLRYDRAEFNQRVTYQFKAKHLFHCNVAKKITGHDPKSRRDDQIIAP